MTLNLGYSTITRWLREFRDKGMPGLSPEAQYPREPYTPERLIAQLIFIQLVRYQEPSEPQALRLEMARLSKQV
jgi:transposase